MLIIVQGVFVKTYSNTFTKSSWTRFKMINLLHTMLKSMAMKYNSPTLKTQHEISLGRVIQTATVKVDYHLMSSLC